MRLSWNEVRVRAAAFADKWRQAAYEKGETQSFYNDFFQIFGVERRTVARYEAHVVKLDNRRGFIDPAFDCGNFLIIAYRELRLLEIDILRELRAVAYLSRVSANSRPVSPRPRCGSWTTS